MGKGMGGSKGFKKKRENDGKRWTERRSDRDKQRDGTLSGHSSKPTACQVCFNVNSTKWTTRAALLL